jgi:spore germination cell wall hydrolase CwlJ-like protein
MSRRTRPAAVFTAAIAAILSFVSAGTSGAYAQDTAPSAAHAPIAGGATMPEQPRFIADPVVQPLPDDESESELLDDADSLRELVSDMPIDGTLSPDLRCLAAAIYFEARGEPLAGQLAVGEVVVNRAEADAFPDSYCGVVRQPAQFSFVRGGRIPPVNTDTPAWKRAVAIAEIAHRDLWETEAKDALYFHAKRVHPRWARRKLASATIDRHVFYR